ncbi:MAG TPA: putative quinol monooxygenase [Terracidiphilus sp.]|jgi:quinol monooxygenase YgiN
MISFIVRMRFAQQDRAEIADILHELTAASRQEPGCVHFLPHWVQGEPCTVLIYEQYQDHKAEDAHRQSPHFKKYAVAGLYQKMLERNREDLASLS